MFALFVVFWAGQSLAGLAHHNEEQEQHGRPPAAWSDFVRSGEFLESSAENWESEFFQMAAFVYLSAFLIQRGSAESKEPGEKDGDGPKQPDSPGPVHRGGLALSLYSHSLSLSLLALFLVSFALHALGGKIAHNEEAALHGEPGLSLWQFVTSGAFWYQSFQNWQSEFLSVGVLVVLSIFLRERGSAQSKPVAAPHSETGG
jgi:hypothetical protein